MIPPPWKPLWERNFKKWPGNVRLPGADRRGGGSPETLPQPMANLGPFPPPPSPPAKPLCVFVAGQRKGPRESPFGGSCCGPEQIYFYFSTRHQHCTSHQAYGWEQGVQVHSQNGFALLFCASDFSSKQKLQLCGLEEIQQRPTLQEIPICLEKLHFMSQCGGKKIEILNLRVHLFFLIPLSEHFCD